METTDSEEKSSYLVVSCKTYKSSIRLKTFENCFFNFVDYDILDQESFAAYVVCFLLFDLFLCRFLYIANGIFLRKPERIIGIITDNSIF